jgi:hypothetical protein
MSESHVPEFESGGSSPPQRGSFRRQYPSVDCVRCSEPRWPYGGAQPKDYVCQRCTAVLRGERNVLDPATPEQAEAWKASGRCVPPTVTETSQTGLQAPTRRVVASRISDHLSDPHKQRVSGGRFLSPADLPKNSRRAGGRPRKHRTDSAAHAAAQRAYRERRKAELIAANDALLAGGAA